MANAGALLSAEARRLLVLAESSHTLLFKTSTVFPFTFFPTRLYIDENLVDVVYGVFFASEQTVSIPISEIIIATVSTDLFFGTLEIKLNSPMVPTQKISYFWRNEAIRAQRIINGLIVCHQDHVDLSHIETKEARKYIENIGHAKHG